MRKEVIGDATLYLGDCMEILPTLPKVDLILTDPPYGIGRDKGNETRRGSGFYAVQLRASYADDWDYRPSDEVLRLVVSSGSRAIVWGGNYFSGVLEENSAWLVWDKENTMPTFSDCELAWTNLPKTSVKRFRYSNNGLMAKEKDRVHPTQKPVALMRWCIEQAGKASTVCDPYTGSGTTGVACVEAGVSFIGIEREPKYFDIACRRIEQAYKQRPLFDAEPPKAPEQIGLGV